LGTNWQLRGGALRAAHLSQRHEATKKNNSPSATCSLLQWVTVESRFVLLETRATMAHRHGVRLLAAACPRAPRESPTAILFLCGPLSPPAAFAPLALNFSAQGYSVYACDLLRPQFALCTAHPDAVVDRVHAALAEARVYAPPLAIGRFAEAFLLQKYLESFPLAGAALLSPLPPAPLPALQSLMRSGGGGGSGASIPKSPACGAEAAGQAAAALAAALAPRARSASAARMAATFLLRLAQCPVNLEPQPVPMLLLEEEEREEEGGSASEGVAATAALHGLVPARHTPDAAALRAWVAARF
jgi:hypothetical protein